MLTSRAMKLWAVVFTFSAAVSAQAPADGPQPVATMKQLMLDVIHPASNSLLLAINRGAPADDKEWAEVRRGALTLAESGNLLVLRNRTAAWVADAKLLTDAGAAAYKAAEAKDVRALSALADRIDASCTTCHKHFRPGLFQPAR
jgi:cytochrome c556